MTIAKVTPASVAPLATDEALVVTISPNSSLPTLAAGANAIGTVGVTTGPVQGTPRNSTATSVANTANAVTVAAVAGQSVRLAGLDYFTSAGTATLTIADGATTIFSGPASAARTLLLGFPGLTGTAGNAMTITVGAAGVGNTSTLNVIATQY